MPSPFAYFALLVFPLVALFLFRRFGTTQGIIWTILLGYLFLPSKPAFEIPVPGIPVIDKTFLPAFCALILAWVTERNNASLPQGRRRSVSVLDAGRLGAGGAQGSSIQEGTRFRSARAASGSPGRAGRSGGRITASGDAENMTENSVTASRGRWLINLLIALFLIVPVLTTLGNSEMIVIGERALRGFQLYDAGSAVVGVLVGLLPFLMARRHLATTEAHRALVWAFAVAGLIYMVLALYEIRMSPKLNSNIYGFFPHEWRQHLRRGGYRPVVFLHHGLWLGIFLAMATVAAASLVRVQGKPGLWLTAMCLLIVVLWLAKSLGAFMLITIFVPVALLCGVRLQLLIAGIFAGAILVYPMLRGAGWIPVDEIYGIAAQIDQERADSLAFRLINEDEFLGKAARKPLTGWGGQGRWMIFDDESGARTAIPDGRWVITIGQFGWLGYLAEFGLLTLPVMLLALRCRRLGVDMATAGLVLVLIVNVIDLIPNATLTPITWMVAGALAGRYELGQRAIEPQLETDPARRGRHMARSPAGVGRKRSSFGGNLPRILRSIAVRRVVPDPCLLTKRKPKGLRRISCGYLPWPFHLLTRGGIVTSLTSP